MAVSLKREFCSLAKPMAAFVAIPLRPTSHFFRHFFSCSQSKGPTAARPVLSRRPRLRCSRACMLRFARGRRVLPVRRVRLSSRALRTRSARVFRILRKAAFAGRFHTDGFGRCRLAAAFHGRRRYRDGDRARDVLVDASVSRRCGRCAHGRILDLRASCSTDCSRPFSSSGRSPRFSRASRPSSARCGDSARRRRARPYPSFRARASLRPSFSPTRRLG